MSAPSAPASSLTLLRSESLRALERTHAAEPLMERAGAAAAEVALRLLGSSSAPVLVLAGPGNNGGDAFVLARRLQQHGKPVRVVFNRDETRLPPDARHAFERLRAAGVQVHAEVPPDDYALVVDGLLGIGLQRPVTGDLALRIEQINRFRGPVLAMDVPSGLNADTGVVLGIAVRATHTATFIVAKPGLYTLEGPGHCGKLSVHALGIDATGGEGALLSREDFRTALRPRPRNCHKGSYGSLAVIGGDSGMTGAALLAARAGLQLGAGRVFVGLLHPLSVDPVQPELMLRTPMEALGHATATVAGPGMGTSDPAVDVVRRLASADLPLVLDADALNLIALHPVIGKMIARRGAPTVMTPHPAEAARLLSSTTDEVQSDRIATAVHLARRYNASIALKGCGTVLAAPDGRWRVNTTGNPGLASGGSGDVLAGMIGALLAQGSAPWAALCAAVHLHGQAADDLVNTGHGPVGLTASELIPAARARWNRWIDAHAAMPDTPSP